MVVRILEAAVLINLLSIGLNVTQPQITAVPEYLSVAGKRISLPCAINTTEEPISLILWYKGDSDVPIYTLDGRRSPLATARHFPALELGNRAHFDVSARPPFLSLDPVEASDRGDYRCRVDYRRSRTVIRPLRLLVIEPPEDVIIRDEGGQRLSNLYGPLDEGAYLTLQCIVQGGSPPPRVSWWRDGTLLDDNFSHGQDGTTINELTLQKLERSDLLAEIICQASNTNLTEPRTASVMLDLNLRPLDVHISNLGVPMSAGRRYVLECRSEGSRPAAQLSWWKEGVKVLAGRDSVKDNLTLSALPLVPTAADHGKTLACRADNPALPDSALEDQHTLNVYYPPVPVLHFGANIQRSSIREGSDVFLECEIRANPWVTDVAWSFQGRALYSNISAGIIVSNQTLVLQKVRREHRGLYRCSAVNSEGEGMSQHLSLDVQYAPVCRAGQPTVYGTARDENVTVTCHVDADPPDVSFRWSINNTVENVEIKNFHQNGTFSSVSYVPKLMLGYGLLLCWGQNRIGLQKVPCMYRIIPAGPPEPVRRCSAANATARSLAVSCAPGGDGGLKQWFQLEVWPDSEESGIVLANLSSAEEPLFTVSGLPAGATLRLKVYAANAKGRSRPIQLTAHTALPAAKRTAASEEDEEFLSPTIGALVGVLVAIIFVMVVASLIIKIRGRKKRKGKPEEEEIKKNEPSLTKEINEPKDYTSKDPDIILPANEMQVYITGGGGTADRPEHHKLLPYNYYKECDPNYLRTYTGSGPSPAAQMSPDEVAYAEMDFPKGVVAEGRRGRAPVNYATLNYNPKYPTVYSETRLDADPRLGPASSECVIMTPI